MLREYNYLVGYLQVRSMDRRGHWRGTAALSATWCNERPGDDAASVRAFSSQLPRHRGGIDLPICRVILCHFVRLFYVCEKPTVSWTNFAYHFLSVSLSCLSLGSKSAPRRHPQGDVQPANFSCWNLRTFSAVFI